MMLTLLALATIQSKTVALVPKETVWAYSQATLPAGGSFLQTWGADGKSCPEKVGPSGEYSYSYLKWDVSTVPRDAKLVSAKLDLWNVPDPGFTLESAKKTPLEARALTGQFSAASWTLAMLNEVRPAPGITSVFGSAYPLVIHADQPVGIEIDLLLGPNEFRKALAQAVTSTDQQLSLCLTSAIDPAKGGKTCIYKLYGQNQPHENLRPRLKLTFQQQ